MRQDRAPAEQQVKSPLAWRQPHRQSPCFLSRPSRWPHLTPLDISRQKAQPDCRKIGHKGDRRAGRQTSRPHSRGEKLHVRYHPNRAQVAGPGVTGCGLGTVPRAGIDETLENFNHYDLSEIEIEVINSILGNFGCYSGKILEKMTHIEMPWLETRGDLKHNEVSSKNIDKELIAKYFEEIKNKYNMKNLGDIRNYSSELFEDVRGL